MTYKVFIDGGAGTTGLQVADRLAAHPHIDALALGDDLRKDANAKQEMMATVDVTILCLPDAAAVEAAAMAAGLGARVIDASSTHRTNPHWVYGFAEMATGQRGRIAESNQITNPGCYPTGFVALVRPLVDAGIVPADAALTVPAVSGYSGGGTGMINRHDAGELPPLGAYGYSLSHKHLPEMTHYAGLSHAPLFMPAVGNYYAGMLVHVPLHASQLLRNVSAQNIYDVLAGHYEGAALVKMGADAPNVADALADTGMLAADALAGQNHLELFVFDRSDIGQFWLTARLDNLGKGASGAAVQNLNIALGLDECEGLLAQ